MKFSHKIAKLVQPLTYQRAWRRAERFIYPVPLKPIYRRIDQARLAAIQAEYAGSKEHYAKYADVRRWLRPGGRETDQTGGDCGQICCGICNASRPRLARVRATVADRH